ncbi:hypothetical protein cypCar_00049400, partial [Cyprinus carpio]
MPSNTVQLPEADDTEPDLPVPLQNLSGMSLRDDESPSELHDTSHLGVLGAVLDLQPLSQTGSEEENTTTSNNNIIRHDTDLDQLGAPGTGGFFLDGPGESQGYQVQENMMMAMMMMQEAVFNSKEASWISDS